MTARRAMRIQRLPARIALIALVIVVCASVTFPLSWMITTSVQTDSAIMTPTPSLVPRALYLDNYAALFTSVPIDQALWDLCGKECRQPLYCLFGGAMRDEVTYFYYLSQGSPEHVERECAEGVRRGYTCIYLQVGIDSAAETQMLAAIRRTIGPERKVRIDANEAWSVPEGHIEEPGLGVSVDEDKLAHYREAIAGAVQVLRPHLAVILVELEDLDENVMRHDPDLVMPGPCTDRSCRFIPTVITTTCGVAYTFKTISPMTSS